MLRYANLCKDMQFYSEHSSAQTLECSEKARKCLIENEYIYLFVKQGFRSHTSLNPVKSRV